MTLFAKELTICFSYDHTIFQSTDSKGCTNKSHITIAPQNSSVHCITCKYFKLIFANIQQDHITPDTYERGNKYKIKKIALNNPLIELKTIIQNKASVSIISNTPWINSFSLMLALHTVIIQC